MYSAERRRSKGAWGNRVFLTFFCFALFASLVAGIGPQDVLILVNQNSRTSRYIAKLYKQYYPLITDSQILYLSGLADCSGPLATASDEIITRTQYEQLIAQPVRSYLLDTDYPDRISQIKVIITTAGMPYKIEDTVYSDVIYPAGSNPTVVANNTVKINAASVESELVGLWYSDYGSNPFGISNRIVNPYQGYRNSGISLFVREMPGTKNMVWSTPVSFEGPAPKMEGVPSVFGTINRKFNAGDMYLTCRLDGPKNQGKSAIFSVRAMLERAKRASNPSIGVNPMLAVAVLDDVPTSNLDDNRIYNLDSSVNYWIFNTGVPQPPNAPNLLTKDDYVSAFTAMTNASVNYFALNTGLITPAYDLCALLDRRSGYRTNQSDLDLLPGIYPERPHGQGAILVATFGCNGDEGSLSSYILTGGPDGKALFNLVNGAVFTSIESLNAVTMFSGLPTSPVAQGKIVDFIAIGGTGAIGHSFEPRSTAVIDNLYLFYNLLADDDEDGIADLTFAEAAFTAIPYLSWSEVVIGDPLMRIAYGPGQKAWLPLVGDANNDGRVNNIDLALIRVKQNAKLEGTEAEFEQYIDLCDINCDGKVNIIDFALGRNNIGAVADW